MYFLFLFGIFFGGMAWHGMFRVVPFVFSLEKNTPAGKKYASGAGGAGDKLQLCYDDDKYSNDDDKDDNCYGNDDE